MIFVFDLDDTICDTDSYSEKYILNFFKTHGWKFKQIATDVRFADMKFDWSHEMALKWYKTYGDDMMAEFPCKPNAVETINALYDAGHKIVIATARATDWHAKPKEVTNKWLADKKIKHHKLYIGRWDKEIICEEVNADVFVDDDIDIVTRVASHPQNAHMKVFLSTTGFNKNLELPAGVQRMRDFQTLMSLTAEKD